MTAVSHHRSPTVRACLRRQGVVLATACLLLFQAFLGGPALPHGLRLSDLGDMSLCVSGSASAGDSRSATGDSPARSSYARSSYDCALVCQSVCLLAAAVLRPAPVLPLPGGTMLGRDGGQGVSLPVPARRVAGHSARGPPSAS